MNLLILQEDRILFEFIVDEDLDTSEILSELLEFATSRLDIRVDVKDLKSERDIYVDDSSGTEFLVTLR